MATLNTLFMKNYKTHRLSKYMRHLFLFASPQVCIHMKKILQTIRFQYL